MNLETIFQCIRDGKLPLPQISDGDKYEIATWPEHGISIHVARVLTNLAKTEWTAGKTDDESEGEAGEL